MRSSLLAALAATALLVAVGCGDDEDGAGTTRTTATAASRAAQSPSALFAEMRSALGKVKSYRIEARGTSREDGPITFRADVDASGPVQFTMGTKASKASFVILGKDTYLKADERFWKDQADPGDDPRLAALLSDRWLSIPTASAGGTSIVKDFMPAHLARCMVGDMSGVRNTGTDTVGGVPVVRLREETKSGSGAAEFALTATGPALPVELRLIGTATDEDEDAKGPKPPAGCEDDEDDDEDLEITTMRFSRYDAPLDIEPPPGAVAVEDLARDSAEA